MKRLLLFLLLISTSAYTQRLDFVSPRMNIGSGTEITFDNPHPVFKAWRVGTSYQADITVPDGCTSVSWVLRNTRDTTDLVATGHDLTVEWTPVWQTDGNTYDLLVIAYNPNTSPKYFPQLFPGEVTVYPPIPLSEDIDLTFNLASGGMGDKDGAWTDRAAAIATYNPATNYAAGTNIKYNGAYYKAKPGGGGTGNTPDVSPTFWKPKNALVYRITGSYTGSARLLFYWYQSGDLSLPIHFYYDNAVIRTSNGGSFKIASMYNTIHDGVGVDGTYGLDIGNSGSPGLGQRVIIELVENAQAARRTEYLQIGGVKVDNGSQATGGTGCQITADQTGDGFTNNYDNYQARYITMHDIYVTNTRDEGFYLGYKDDLTNNASLKDFLGYRLRAENTGNEGIQFSSMIGRSMIFKSKFTNVGINNNASHRNAFQFGGGSQGVAFFMNEIETSKNIFVGDNGLHGNNIFCFSNKITSTGKNASDGVNLMWTLYQSSIHSTINARFKNNTIVFKSSPFNPNIPIVLFRSVTVTTTTHDKLRFDGNLIVANTATEWEPGNGWTTAVSSGQVVLDNQQFTNIATPLFVDHTTNNYHLSSTSSPAFRSRTIAAIEHWNMAYDFDGRKFMSAHKADGCMSGSELYQN